MKKYIITFTLTILNFAYIYAQETFKDEAYGFQMEQPTQWFEASNQELINNLAKIQLSDPVLLKVLSDHKGSVLLTSFYKYNPKSHPGLIPTIQVNIRAKKDNSFEDFKNVIIESSKSFKNYFPDFKYIVEPSEIEIDGIKSVYSICEFTLESQYNQVLKVRSRTYAIPLKNYFFQVNFTDGYGTKEDSNKLFDELVETIKISK